MFLFLYPKKPVAKPSLSNPSLPYKMGKEKSVRNDNKEEQKLQKILSKNLFLLLTKNKNSYRQSQLFFIIEKRLRLSKVSLGSLFYFLDKDVVHASYR